MGLWNSTGRWRDKYADGKPIEDSAALADKTEINGVNGLLNYLKRNDDQVRRTLSHKLLGFALGRTVQASDQPLIDKLSAAGSEATFVQLASEIVTSKQFRNHLVRDDATPASTVKTASAAPKNSDKVGAQ